MHFKLNTIIALAGCLLPAYQAESQNATAEHSANPALYDQIKKCCQPTQGVQFQISYSGEALGDVSGGYRQGAICEGLLRAGVQVDLEKQVGWKGASIFANALYPHGQSLTQHYVHDLNVVSNIDAYNSLRLDEAWFQQAILDNKFSIRLGLLAADNEFFVCDSGSVFISSTFGTIPVISLNYNAPVYPVAAPAVRLDWNVTKAFLLRTGIYGGDLGSTSGNNQHGGRISFSPDAGALILTEAVYKTHVDEHAPGLPGTFKIGAFCHTGKIQKIDGSGGTRHSSIGCYAVVDQALYREPTCACANGRGDKDSGNKSDQGLNCFSRVGATSQDDSNTASAYVEAGLTYKGLFPTRDQDTIGVGCSFVKISDDLRDASGAAVPSHHETVIEATYQAAITDWLSFQPDFQYVINPGGTSDTSNATIIGARFTLSF